MPFGFKVLIACSNMPKHNRWSTHQFGSHVSLGRLLRKDICNWKTCTIHAADIWLTTWLGPLAAVSSPQGRNSFVRDNCRLLAGCVLPEGVVVPPFTVVSGEYI